MEPCEEFQLWCCLLLLLSSDDELGKLVELPLSVREGGVLMLKSSCVLSLQLQFQFQQLLLP